MIIISNNLVFVIVNVLAPGNFGVSSRCELALKNLGSRFQGLSLLTLSLFSEFLSHCYLRLSFSNPILGSPKSLFVGFHLKY
ncbi:hypothetical protein Lal_00026494 [Lupinus albus]|nr:hypothetical protein Lal_00026494 [Lupinus albus]